MSDTVNDGGLGSSVLPAPRRDVRWLAVGLVVVVLLALTGSAQPEEASAATPAAPTQLSPNDDSSRMYNHLELTWRAVPGATSYEVQVSDTGRFDGDGLTAEPILARWTLPTSTPTGDYVWRVRARSADGPGAWSTTAQFTRGWAQAPSRPVTFTADGSPVPGISWAPIPDASFYEVEFSRVPFTAGTPPYEGTLYHYTCYTAHTFLLPYGVIAGEENPPGPAGSCAFDVVSEAAEAGTAMDGSFHVGTTYYWRVRGRDGTVGEPTTPFTAPAVACTGVWLDSDVKVSEPVEPAPDPGGEAEEPAETEPEVAVTVPIGGEPPDYEAIPECSAWLDGGSFTVGAAPVGATQPPAPTGLRVEPTTGSPTGTTVPAVDTPLFRWNPVPGAAKYRVYVSRSPDVRDADHVWETYGASLMPYGTLPDRSLKTYWTVQACTAATFCSSSAPVRSFTKVSAVTAAPTRTKTSGFQTMLTWSLQHPQARSGQVVPAGPSAKAYQVQVAPAGAFDRPVIDQTVDRVAPAGNTTTSHLALATHRLLDGTYTWRVRPVDEAGQQLPWSQATGQFAINRQRPVVALRKPAAPLAARGALRLAFSEPVTGVSGRSVGVKVAGTSRRVAGTLRKVDPLTWAFTPSKPWSIGQSYTPWVTSAVRDAGRSTVLPIRYAVRASTRAEAGGGAVRARAGDYRWTRVRASDVGGGTYLRTTDRPATKARASLTATVTGSRVSLVACRTPSSGIASVRVDSRVYRVDLYRSYSGCGRVWTSPRLRKGTHTVVVATTGTKRSVSRGYQLGVDAITVS